MISVIIPAYNAQKFLEECVASVLAQEGLAGGMEIIIVDDGSTDNTPAMADDMAQSDSRIRVVHTSNQGLAAARNVGLGMMHGQFVCFVDADDILLPEALTSMRADIISSRADVLVASVISGTKYPGTISISHHFPQIINGIGAIERMLYQNGLNSAAWGRLYRRSSIGDLRFTPGIYYEDLDFNYRFMLACPRIALSATKVYFYRQHPDSFIHKWSEKRLDVLRVTDFIEKSVAENAPALVQAASDRKLSANFNICIIATMNKRRDVADKCWETVKAYRRASFINPAVSMKNKLGIALSYLGRRPFIAIARLIYRQG